MAQVIATGADTRYCPLILSVTVRVRKSTAPSERVLTATSNGYCTCGKYPLFPIFKKLALLAAFDEIVPEMNGVKHRHVISERSRNKSLKGFLLRLIGILPAI
jgi:hypothetical protein